MVLTQAHASCPFMAESACAFSETRLSLPSLIKLLMGQPDVQELSVLEDQIQDAMRGTAEDHGGATARSAH